MTDRILYTARLRHPFSDTIPAASPPSVHGIAPPPTYLPTCMLCLGMPYTTYTAYTYAFFSRPKCH